MKNKPTGFDYFLIVALGFIAFITLYPFLNVLAISFNDANDTIKKITKLKITTAENGPSIITAAKNLLKAGYELRVYDRNQATLEEMKAAGAAICSCSALDAASWRRAAITSAALACCGGYFLGTRLMAPEGQASAHAPQPVHLSGSMMLFSVSDAPVGQT